VKRQISIFEICLPPILGGLQRMRSSYKTRKEVSRFVYVNKILCITKKYYFTEIYSNTTINLSKQNTLLGSPTLDLEAKTQKNNNTNHLQ
jgi:hypothetical protein